MQHEAGGSFLFRCRGFSSFIRTKSQVVTTVSHSTIHPLSTPLPCGLRCRTPTHTPLVSSPSPQPFLCRELELALQLWTRLLSVYEIAEAASYTALPAV